MPAPWSPALRTEAERIAARGGDMQFDATEIVEMLDAIDSARNEAADSMQRVRELIDEWSADAERAGLYFDKGAGDATNVREALTFGEAAAQIRAVLDPPAEPAVEGTEA